MKNEEHETLAAGHQQTRNPTAYQNTARALFFSSPNASWDNRVLPPLIQNTRQNHPLPLAFCSVVHRIHRISRTMALAPVSVICADLMSLGWSSDAFSWLCGVLPNLTTRSEQELVSPRHLIKPSAVSTSFRSTTVCWPCLPASGR